jgi:hypothetical protein
MTKKCFEDSCLNSDSARKLARLKEIENELAKLPRIRWDVAVLMERIILLYETGLYQTVGP